MHDAESARGRVGPARFLDPAVLARIGNLDLIARGVVDGFVSGMHRALFLGMSTEFAEHRAYAPGDDVRRIDWRLFARTDRLYLKTFEADTNADIVLAIDVSRSMDWAGTGIRKLDYARFLAASLAHLGARQRDRVGVATFDERLVDVLPPAAGRRDAVLVALERIEPGGRGDLAVALDRLGAVLRRRGIVVVISDFYETPHDAGVALEALRTRGHDVIAFQVIDPVERGLELDHDGVLEDAETGERMPVIPHAARAAYRDQFEEHLVTLALECGRRAVDYACFETTQPLDHVLARYLGDRARLARVR